MSLSRVLIVGSGIAGVSLGAHLVADHQVVVLEAEADLASHSTGRSAALYLPDYGPEPVKALTLASAELFAAYAAAPDIPPLLLPREALLTAWDDGTAGALAGSVAAAQGGLLPLTAAQAGDRCAALRIDTLRSAALDRRACDIDVMALHAYYLGVLRRAGGQVVTRARVQQIESSPVGWQVTTKDGRTWSADRLVNAAGAWGDEVCELAGQSRLGLTPRRRTVAIARPNGPIDARWPVVADAAEAWYFKPEGGALLLSPCDETPVTAGDSKPDALDVARVMDQVNAVTTLQLRSVVSSWSGLRTFTGDRVPVVGAHPGDARLFCFVGQGGYGIQMAPALAVLAAELFRTGTTDGPLDWVAEAMRPERLLTAAVSQV